MRPGAWISESALIKFKHHDLPVDSFDSAEDKFISDCTISCHKWHDFPQQYNTIEFSFLLYCDDKINLSNVFITQSTKFTTQAHKLNAYLCNMQYMQKQLYVIFNKTVCIF